jgi:hypothetical protein
MRNARDGGAVSSGWMEDGSFTLEDRQAYTEMCDRARFDRSDSRGTTVDAAEGPKIHASSAPQTRGVRRTAPPEKPHGGATIAKHEA